MKESQGARNALRVYLRPEDVKADLTVLYLK